MGITGLWKIVEPTCTEIPLECLEGKKLAVDVSIWIYQAQLAYPSDQPYPHLRLLINRLCKLLFYKIRPVFVFDGPNVPALKKQVLDARRAKKLQDDDVLTNPKKLTHLRQIASGQLTDEQLAKTVQHVISPTKRVILNDVYKDMPSTSTAAIQQEECVDQIYVQSEEEEEDGDEEVQCFYERIVEDLKIPENATRRQTIDTLVERRETMRKSRLHPSMIPENSQDFSRFQMQRLLRRGRLNAEIDAAANSNTANSSNDNKINVVGPDGTQHVLKYSHTDEVQLIKPENKRDIEAIYNRGEDRMDLSLAYFNVEYGGAQLSKKPEIVEDEDDQQFRLQDEPIYQSKSGMLEAIARKRVRNHYKKDEASSSDDEFVDVSDSEVQVISNEKNVEDVTEQVWDPEKIDRDQKTQQQQKSTDISIDDEWLKTNYEDDDKTPEMYRDLQEFLTNCGIPWLEAPGEAEAQCVELERLGLVDGVISDDSDVWAFGVRNVYRHMFAKNKRVQRYSRAAEFCLEREDFIAIGILAGGDYSSGLNRVGAIGALELVAEFVENRKDKIEDLEEVERRIIRLLSKIFQLFTNPQTKTPSKSRIALTLRRHVTEANDAQKIAMICENAAAVNAYLHPNVDSSTEKFRWRKVNIELIRNITQQRLRWGDADEMFRNSQQIHEQKNSLEAFERWNGFLQAGGVSQMRLDRFFTQPVEKSALTWSKKVMEAFERISKRSTGTLTENDDYEIIVEKQISPKKKPAAVKRARKPAAKKGPRAKKPATKPVELNLSEESSDDSF